MGTLPAKLVHRLTRCLLLAMLAFVSVAATAQTAVIYPRPESDTDMRTRYPLRLLEQALLRAGGQYRVQLSKLKMQQGRALAQLQKSDGIDVVNFMTSVERESQFLPIRIPTERGLIGWRLLLIRSDQGEQFRTMSDTAVLKALKAGQGFDWPDTEILRSNGYTVYTGPNYEGLFGMLENHRIDYFPRSITEIWDELERHQQQGLAVEPSIVLHYPSGSYFFVNKSNTKLAAAITVGLEKMLADGSLDKLFHEFYDDVLKKANLKNRRIIELNNPLMSPDTPFERKALWYRE
jgi:hypothetical protein